CIRETDRFLEAFWHSKDLAEAYRFATEESESPEAAVFEMGYKELQKLNHALVPQVRGEETVENRLASMENLKRVLRKAQQQELSRLGGTLAFLATTGSSTPFIGLFGTVWGIMTSFHEIGMRGSASLTVVAPGISEALVATAAGLAVAIPAVIFYNYFSNQLMELEGAMQNFSSDFLNLVERDLITRKI
ncbi:MAG: Tol-Pal system subunit TolQ, partial [Deltaproteobacteria bacterium CG_4_10_14_3_um_filter_60_8]